MLIAYEFHELKYALSKEKRIVTDRTAFVLFACDEQSLSARHLCYS